MSSPKHLVARSFQQATIKETGIPIRSIYDSTMRYEGRVSGKLYTWQKIGDVVHVLPEDAPYLLKKRLGGRSCCGGSGQNGNKIFELVEEAA